MKKNILTLGLLGAAILLGGSGFQAKADTQKLEELSVRTQVIDATKVVPSTPTARATSLEEVTVKMVKTQGNGEVSGASAVMVAEVGEDGEVTVKELSAEDIEKILQEKAAELGITVEELKSKIKESEEVKVFDMQEAVPAAPSTQPMSIQAGDIVKAVPLTAAEASDSQENKHSKRQKLTREERTQKLEQKAAELGLTPEELKTKLLEVDANALGLTLEELISMRENGNRLSKEEREQKMQSRAEELGITVEELKDQSAQKKAEILGVSVEDIHVKGKHVARLNLTAEEREAILQEKAERTGKTVEELKSEMEERRAARLQKAQEVEATV